MCTRRRPDKSGKHLRALNESVKRELSTPERLRMARVLANICAQVEIDKWKFPGLPSHLVGADRIMQRWASAPTGSLSENPDVYFECKAPPLDDKTQEKVADILKVAKASIPGIWEFVLDWYCRNVPTDVMAKNRHMSRRQLIREWQDVLVYLRQKFLMSAHADLTTLVRQLP